MATQNPTTNFNWDLPFTGASIGVWGEMLNKIFGDDATGIDKILGDVKITAEAALPKAGGEVTGALTVGGGLTLGEGSALTIEGQAGDQAVTVGGDATFNGRLHSNFSFQVNGLEVISASRALKNLSIPAGLIDSGTLNLDRIPNLPWSKITSGVPVYATRWPNFSEIGSVPAALGRVALPSGFGSVSLDGSSSGVAGIEFQDTGQLLFMSRFHQGVQTDGVWEWRFSGGELTIGTVPWGSVSGKPSTFAPSAHSHVVAQSTRPAGVEGRIWVKT